MGGLLQGDERGGELGRVQCAMFVAAGVVNRRTVPVTNGGCEDVERADEQCTAPQATDSIADLWSVKH